MRSRGEGGCGCGGRRGRDDWCGRRSGGRCGWSERGELAADLVHLFGGELGVEDQALELCAVAVAEINRQFFSPSRKNSRRSRRKAHLLQRNNLPLVDLIPRHLRRMFLPQGQETADVVQNAGAFGGCSCCWCGGSGWDGRRRSGRSAGGGGVGDLVDLRRKSGRERRIVSRRPKTKQ